MKNLISEKDREIKMVRKTPAKMNQWVFLWVCLFFSSAAANIGEYDEYWKNRETQARKNLQEAYHPEPFNVTNEFNLLTHQIANKTRRGLSDIADDNPEGEGGGEGPCQVTNPMDACWRCDPNWEMNRKRLADCAMGFAKGTTGGKDGEFYVVTDDTDDDIINPKPGTLRFGATQVQPLWIIFDRPMKITLQQELMITNDKTIDARGSNVHIEEGSGITLQFVRNVIIHGLHVHDIHPGSGGMIRDSTDHYGFRTQSDGDNISLFGATNVWIDHCSLSRGSDGLIDIIQGSTAITISNNHMTHHNDVFLFGATNDFQEDRKMQITVAFNHFGKGLVQRMPRVRFGFVHVVNNDYTHWIMYAIGGSQGPTIVSQGNRFIAPDSVRSKEVTHRVDGTPEDWKTWTWISEFDEFINGAYFSASGATAITDERKNFLIPPRPGVEAPITTMYAGPRDCNPGEPC